MGIAPNPKAVANPTAATAIGDALLTGATTRLAAIKKWQQVTEQWYHLRSTSQSRLSEDCGGGGKSSRSNERNNGTLRLEFEVMTQFSEMV